MSEPLPLRDIHLPEPVSWFPPAIGWWLALLLLVLAVVSIGWLIRRWKKSALNKRAVVEVESVIEVYRDHQDKSRFIRDLSAALKRIGMSYFTREKVAGMSGIHWLERLNSLVVKNRLDDLQVMLLASAPYQQSPALDDDEVNTLIDEVRRWAAALPRLKREGGDV